MEREGGREQRSTEKKRMEFEKRKAAALEGLASAIGDKSPKGSLDTPIVPLIHSLNQHPSYFTTSSCSGRISILSQPPPQTLAGHIVTQQKKKKAGGGSWLFITHDPADSDSVIDVLFGSQSSSSAPPGALVFRFEPFILAVDCRDVASAQALVCAAISCGFRESGVTNMHRRVMVAVRCSIRLEVPLGETGLLMVSPEYVRYLVGIANEKMMANKKRTDGFLQVLLGMVSPGPTVAKMDNHLGKQRRLSNHQGTEPDIYGNCREHQSAESAELLTKDNGTGTISENEHEGTEPAGAVTSRESENQDADSTVLLSEDNGIVPGSKSEHQVTEPARLATEVNQTVTSSESGHQDTESDKLLTNINGTITSCESSTKDVCISHQSTAGDVSSKRASTNLGLLEPPGCLFAVKMNIVGEPVEKLFLWGQSAGKLNDTHCKQILIFGGFGGLGRHARRNDSLILDPKSETLKMVNAKGPPSPRVGHTLSVIGEHVFVIGGRGDPAQILNDVWFLDVSKSRWKLLDCTGSFFHPRHRHAAAIIGSKIYVFGGLSNDMIYSCMPFFDTESFRWLEVKKQGDWPCPRHSHSLAAYGSQLFLFGGYDGQKALGDLYSFDIRTSLWKQENTIGKAPHARFSHSMFIYKFYLGIVGGCPVTQQFQEVALLDLRTKVWRHVVVGSIGKGLLVRSTTVVVDDNLVIVGGGASCYAFGTKFDEPTKIDLTPVIFSDGIPSNMEDASIAQYDDPIQNLSSSSGVVHIPSSNHDKTSSGSAKLNHAVDRYDGQGTCSDAKKWVLQLERNYAKLGKDILKKFGWLDRQMKVYSSQDGCYICLPITEKAYAFFQEKACCPVDSFDSLDGFYVPGPFAEKGFSLNDISPTIALNLLSACGSSICSSDVTCVRKSPRSPQNILKEAVCSLIKSRGLPLQLLEQLPTRWERLGDILVLPSSSFKDPIWDSVGEELWPTVTKLLGARRLARQGRIVSNETRDSTLEILFGDSGWVDHHENGIVYAFDATKCMFSKGNLSEKLRMARLDCRDEVVVDLFAGIGYFVLPFLVKAKAKLVYACEWNPHAVEALQHNVQSNLVAERCVILKGDNRVTAPRGVADRVCLGLLPTSESSWVTAVRALRPEGGVLHVHENVKDSDEDLWLQYAVVSICHIAESEGYSWDVSIQHLERVKWYGPHIRHLVADVRCKQM